ncbi:HEAT repeat domain-containing protein [Halorubrum coriense]|uniref:HEAT repeat domain-containing protein n=1 Tax=Halorubrum coriense TaxID=64713 RepID=UPI0009B59E79|nr:HEAT repeat domain-containing protein [Halorubrum coriense]
MTSRHVGESKVRFHRRLIDHFRRQWFALIYAAVQNSSQGPFFFWFPGVAIYRSGSKQQRKKEVTTPRGLSKLGNPLILFIIVVGITLMFGTIGLVPGIIIGIIIFVIGTIVSLWGLFLGTLDYRNFKQIKSLNGSQSAQSAAEAFQYVSASQPEIRYNALNLISRISEGTPGKVLKQSNRDAPAIAELLIQSLRSENNTERQLAATTIRCYSRDYAPSYQPFARELASLVDYPDSVVQTEVVIALGNIGRTATDPPVPYAKAISSAAKDEDPDVRQATALALGKLNCRVSRQVLQHLAADTAPAVRIQAVQSQQALGTQ